MEFGKAGLFKEYQKDFFWQQDKTIKFGNVFNMPRTAGRGKIVRKTLKTHITHHFMPLVVLLASFILTTIHVSFEKMSMK